MLPSQVYEHATTLDVMVMDVKSSWDEYHQGDDKKKAEMMVEHMGEEDMMAMLAQARDAE